MEPRYAAQYRRLYERHWWWRARERLVLRWIDRLGLGDARILDVGCGDGLLFPGLARYGQVEGIEPDEQLIGADSPWRGSIHVRSFDPSFRPGHRYHLILMLDVIEHLAEPEEALRHARSLLEPGGWLLVTVPALPSLWTAHDDFNRHLRRYRRAELRSSLERSGFEVRELRYLFLWPVAGKLLVRLAERLRPGTPTVARIPWRPINALLLALTRLDLALGSRWPLPLGSSLAALAVRGERSA